MLTEQDCWEKMEEIIETSVIPSTAKIEELIALAQMIILKRRLE